MRAPTSRFAVLAFAILGALLPWVPARAALAPQALLDSLSARYATLHTFHFEGQMISAMVRDSLEPPARSEAPFVFAGRGPGRVRNEIRSSAMGTTTVADGDSVRVLFPALRQYMVRRVPANPDSSDLASVLKPMRFFGDLAANVTSATDAGRDTVVTSAGPVDCRRIELAYIPQSRGGATSTMARSLWVDEARMIVLRDSISVTSSGAGGHAGLEQGLRFALADVTSGGPDALYTLAVPADFKRVRQPQRPGAEGPDLEGKPAPEFTLANLAGTTRVSLRALRGKVVVLDFWATWCGPCRRWMPIVAKLERELKGRNVRFFAVNERDQPQEIRDFLKEAGVTVPVLLDRDGKVGQLYGASSIPLTVIVGADGKVAQVLLGLHPEDDLRDALRDAGVTGL